MTFWLIPGTRIQYGVHRSFPCTARFRALGWLISRKGRGHGRAVSIVGWTMFKCWVRERGRRESVSFLWRHERASFVDGAPFACNLLARIFREVGCSRIASFCWDQGTGVHPTQPINLTLTLTPTRTKTGQKRARNAAAPLSHRRRNFADNSERGPNFPKCGPRLCNY